MSSSNPPGAAVASASVVPQPSAVPTRVYLLLGVGLVAASQSGNLVRLGDASPVAIAAWRLALASLIFAPIAGRGLAELRRLSRREWGLLVAAGVLLALHFFAWIAAVQLTTVANAAIFFSVNPLFTAAAAALLFRERLGGRLLLAMTLGLAGVAVLGAGELAFDRDNLPGDAVAMLCGLLFSGYLLVSKRLRRALSTPVLVTGLYAVAAAFSFAVLVALGEPLVAYSPMTWGCFVLMAVVPTGIGHTAFNNALGYVRAGWLSAATLMEPMLAGLVAFFAWGEAVTPQAVGGYVLICACVLLLAMDRSGDAQAVAEGAGLKPAAR